MAARSRRVQNLLAVEFSHSPFSTVNSGLLERTTNAQSFEQKQNREQDVKLCVTVLTTDNRFSDKPYNCIDPLIIDVIDVDREIIVSLFELNESLYLND